MAISQQLQDRIEALAVDLRRELYAPRGIRRGERSLLRSKNRREPLAAAAWQRGFAPVSFLPTAFTGPGH